MIACSGEAIGELHASAYQDQIDSWLEYLWAGRGISENFPADDDISTSSSILFVGAIILALTTFAAIHVASWHEKLASTIELWIWRASSLYCLAFASAFAFYVVLHARDKYEGCVRGTLLWFLAGGTHVYIIVRIYMIIEVFISLWALPASTFQSAQWPSFIPHI